MYDSKKNFLLVTLHDVAPNHLERLEKADAMFTRLGIHKVQYLFVPEFHGRYRASEYPEFLDWCRQKRSMMFSWALHGYYHLERHPDDSIGVPLGFKDRLKRKFLTAGEGEFLSIDSALQKKRLAAGMEEFAKCIPKSKLEGFVAPAWLFRKNLLGLLQEAKLPFTEDHTFIYNVVRNLKIPAPVITWATRTSLYKYGSLLVCPLRAWWFNNEPVLRMALHPHDFDHIETVMSIEQLLRKLSKERFLRFPDELKWDDYRGNSE